MTTLEHSIVMGGSMAGLLAAAALAPHSARVTIVDRDPLPVDGPDAGNDLFISDALAGRFVDLVEAYACAGLGRGIDLDGD